VRFFVAGRGQFTLHIGEKVYEVLCVQGDLIGVPDRTRHWFDMSEKPYFIAIRLFTNKEGWVANFTGNDIAGEFPRLAAEAIAA
jgi:1,2-dihydroxy-3-keto-5-methylthiopentene dioxygenase